MKSPYMSADKTSGTSPEALTVGLGARSYDIHIGEFQLSRLGDILSEFAPAKRVAIITDENVERLYGDAIRRALSDLSLIHI